MPNYESKEPINLQEAIRDIDSRLKGLEKPQPIEKYPPEGVFAEDKPKSDWTPTPPKK